MSPAQLPDPDQDDAPPNRFETIVSTVMGCLMLVVAAALCYWSVRLALSGMRANAWPSGLAFMLPAALLASTGAGFGSWRMLMHGQPHGLAGVSVGRVVFSAFLLAIVLGLTT